MSSAAFGPGVIVSGALGEVIGIAPIDAALCAGYVLVGVALIGVFGVPAAVLGRIRSDRRPI